MKPVACVLQKTPDGLMVFNDAIVDNGNGLCLIRMGMGIQIAGDAVCRPSRMTDPGCLRPAAAFHRRLQRRQASPGFYCRQALGSDKGHTCGIISAVFEFFQSLHQKGQSRSGACKCSDSTHKKTSIHHGGYGQQVCSALAGWFCLLPQAVPGLQVIRRIFRSTWSSSTAEAVLALVHI